MAKIIDKINNDNVGEAYVYKCIEKNLSSDIVAYYNRIVNGLQFDFCLLIKNIGLIVIEVKGWKANNIIKVNNPDDIHTSIYDKPVSSPKKQVRGYRFSLLNHFNNHYSINPLVMDMVCYPFISEQEYKATGLSIVSEPQTTLFKEDIESGKLFSQKLLNAYRELSQSNYDKMSGKTYDAVRKYFENDYDANTSDSALPYSVLSIFPSDITLSEIDDLVKQYFAGVKQIVFTQSKESVLKIKENLEKKLNDESILVKGKKFVLNSDANNNISIIDDGFSLFNFECYYIGDLENIISNRQKIINGDVTDDTVLKFCDKNTGFNYQQYLVEHADVSKDIQVKAGAGTGKTYSMISRISYICCTASNSGVLDPADEIAMLTFTTEAATNMKQRLKLQFMNYFVLTKDKRYLSLINSIERMRISTIHSFAKNVIQNTSLPLGIGTDFQTVSGQYQRQRIFHRVFNDYLKETNDTDSSFFFSLPFSMYEFEKKILRFSELLYNKGFDIKTSEISAFGKPVAEMPYFLDVIERVIKKTEIEYAKYLFENNSVYLGEYMVYLNKCIADTSFNKNIYKYKYVFIDEFQDVDDSQINAFLLMKKKLHFNFFIVGDLKQSIYRFRGATMDAFTKMGCENDSWDKYSLGTNYRSDKRLLDEYDILFSNMGKSNLIPYQSGEDTLTGVRKDASIEDSTSLVKKIEYNAQDEKDGIFYDKLFEIINTRVDELREKSKTQKLSAAEKTVAILVRTNAQISTILRKAKDANITIESDANGNLYRLQSSIDLCKLTAALSHPYNPTYLFDLIESNNVNVTFSVASIIGLSDEEKTEKMIDCLSQYYQMTMGLSWESLIKEVQNKPILMMLRKIYESTKPWKADSNLPERQAYYRTNYELLFEDMSRTNKRSYLTLDSINESLHIAITTGADASSRELVDSNDYVKVICTTVHGSKGLEYDSVIMPYTNDKIDVLKRNSIDVTYVGEKVGYIINLPKSPIENEYFLKDNELEECKMEESRILYVALTRAINRFVWFEKSQPSGNTWGTILEDLEICQ